MVAPSMSRKHLPAAVLVSMDCSVALRDSAARLHGANDILHVADAPGEAINTARFEFRKMRCRC
jgi:hypothetical protein